MPADHNSLNPRGFAHRTPLHALSRGAASARSDRVARSRYSLARHCEMASREMIARTRRGVAIGATIAVTLFGALDAISARQSPIVQPADEKALREYTGVYQWGPNAYLYLQMWDEFSGFGKPQ